MTAEKRLRFGATLGAAVTGAEVAAYARLLEAADFEALYCGDHLPGRWPEPFPPLTWAAASTERLHVGTLVLANDFRNPVLLAKAATTLDRLSGGRLRLGIGAGWWDRDYAMLGQPFDRPGVRLARLEEALTILRTYWAGERFDFTGRYYAVRDVDPGPLPARPGGPPIMIGGGGPKVLALAGRVADIVGPNPTVRGGRISHDFFRQMTREQVAQKLRWARDAAVAAGRDPDGLIYQSMVNYLAIAESPAEGERLRQKIVESIGLSPAEVADAPTMLVGTAAEIVERLRRDRDELGFTDWVLTPGEVRGFGTVTTDTLLQVAREVMAPLGVTGPR